jgi:hypothetical protein
LPKIKIDDVEYNSEDLSDAGRGQLQSLQFLETQLQQLRNEIAVYQTAHAAYVSGLKAEIEQSGIEPIAEMEAEGD